MEALVVAESVLQAAGPELGRLLSEAGSGLADAASARLAESVVAAGATGFVVLWRRVLGRAQTSDGDGPALSQAAQAVVAAPGDPAARAALAREVAIALREDPILLADAAAWAGTDGDVGGAAGDVAGPRAVQARDVVNSTIVTGDGNRIG